MATGSLTNVLLCEIQLPADIEHAIDTTSTHRDWYLRLVITWSTLRRSPIFHGIRFWCLLRREWEVEYPRSFRKQILENEFFLDIKNSSCWISEGGMWLRSLILIVKVEKLLINYSIKISFINKIRYFILLFIHIYRDFMMCLKYRAD